MTTAKYINIIKKQWIKGLCLLLIGTTLLSLPTSLQGQIRVIAAKKETPKKKRLSSILLEAGSGLPNSWQTSYGFF